MISKSPEKDFKQNPNSEQQHVQFQVLLLACVFPHCNMESQNADLQSGIKPGKSRKIREKVQRNKTEKKKKSIPRLNKP